MLDEFLQAMPEAERKAILRLVADGGGDPGELAYALPSARLRPQSGQTDSRAYNATWQELARDLDNVYRILTSLGRASSNQFQLEKTLLSNLRRGIGRLEDDLSALQDYRGGIYYKDFRLVQETDREKVALLGGDMEEADIIDGSLRLAAYLDRDCLRTSTGRPLAELRVLNFIGKPLPNSIHGLDLAMDQDYSSYWQETVWTHVPLDVPAEVLRRTPDDELFYGDVRGGAMAAMELLFKYPVPASELIITPCARYPVELVSAIAYEDRYARGPFKVLLEKPHYLAGPFNICFPEFYTRRIRLLFRQPHYERVSYYIPASRLVTKDLRANVRDTAFRPDVADVEERNRLEQWPGLASASKDLQADGLVPVNFCEYVYGLEELQARERRYRQQSVYLTEPIVFPGTLRQVSLAAEEEHPLVDGRRFTDVEYDVWAGGAWLPVLPQGKRVECERLWGPRASLRFELQGNLQVYKNGQPFNDYELVDGELVLHNYFEGAIYTASYDPAPSAYVAEMGVHPRDFVTGSELGESFAGTDRNGEIRLSYYPYIDYRELVEFKSYNEGHAWTVMLPTGASPLQVLVDGTPYQNVTDYVYGARVTPADGQYVQDADVIRFAGQLNVPIRVLYRYVGSETRLRITLRRNVFGYDTLTPQVKAIRLIPKTVGGVLN